MKIFATFLLSGLLAMTAGPGASRDQDDGFAHYRRSTVALGQLLDDGNARKFNTLGTGVIVQSEQCTCLITAKHVVSGPGYAPTILQMRLALEDGDPPFGVTLQLVDRFGKNLWRSLPDDSDLAVMPLPDMTQYKNLRAIGFHSFGIRGDLVQGGNVVIIGYPSIVSALTNTQDILVSPIARGGIIAWVDPLDAANKPFIVDANLWQGNSGGPVFRQTNGVQPGGDFTLGGELKLIGIVSKGGAQRAPVRTESQPLVQVDQSTGQVEQFYALVNNVGGIGYIEPISKVKSLVEAVCPP
ncbi:UNVERIFIED_ORG: hypothetical protein J2W74_001959 [Methylorubrum zatmanii]